MGRVIMFLRLRAITVDPVEENKPICQSPTIDGYIDANFLHPPTFPLLSDGGPYIRQQLTCQLQKHATLTGIEHINPHVFQRPARSEVS